ncbi:hypothetical protein Tco_1248144 [Tanacetum coccineum]
MGEHSIIVQLDIKAENRSVKTSMNKSDDAYKSNDGAVNISLDCALCVRLCASLFDHVEFYEQGTTVRVEFGDATAGANAIA